MRSLFGGGPPFRDRKDAGEKLAVRLVESLEAGWDEAPVVFALPRGGVPVAYHVAVSLDAALDVILARKLGAPDQPELGIGAVAQGGKRILNSRVVEHLGVSDEYIERAARREMKKIESSARRFREGRDEAEVRGKTAILVDDGLATGVTALAAILAVEDLGPKKVILAAPVCALQTSRTLSREVDELVCLEYPAELGAIGFWYEDFEQVSDEKVVEFLEASRRREG